MRDRHWRQWIPAPPSRLGFLALSGGVLSLKDRVAETGLEVHLPDVSAPHVAFVHLGADEMALSRDGHVFQRGATGQAFAPGSSDLFLGCIRKRGGLPAMLGPHRIADLVALPDIDLTDPDHAMLRAAFRSYAQEIFTDGI